MSDHDLPDLPSDEELGITDEDRRRFEEDAPEEQPELSAEELLALLETPEQPAKAPGAKKSTGARKKASVSEGEPEAPSPQPQPEGPRSRWKGPVTLAILAAAVALASSRTGLPEPVPANADVGAFSSARAMAMLVEIARAPHPTGSPEHARVRSYLVDRLSDLGLEPVVQTTTSMIQRGGGARAATVRNVLARAPGTSSSGAVLITAHYDSRELSPGAGDDGSGVVAILEALRAVRTAGPLRNDVIVLFTDAEELGLLGARAFVDEHAWLEDVAVVLSFEMRGGGGPSVMFETAPENGWIVRALADFDPHPFANSLFLEVYRRMPNDTDFTPLREAGKQGLNFAGLDNAHVYHQASDTPANFSESTLQHHGVRALAALEYLGQADLGSVLAPDVVHFSVPTLGLVVYGGGWIVPISVGLLGLFGAVLLIARSAGRRPRHFASALLVAVLGGAASYGAGLGVARWVSRFHAEAGSLQGSLFHSEGWYVLGLAAGVFAIVTTFYAIARRWLGPADLAIGAVLVPALGAVALSFLAPFGAMNLQWPVMAALVSAGIVATLGARVSGTVGWVATMLLALPPLLMLTPMVELLWLSMSFAQVPIVAALMALTLHLCLPALESLRHPNSWWAPLLSLVVGAAAVGAGVWFARPSADHPAPSTLVYTYEHGTGSALWATAPATDTVLDAEALRWATERVASPFSQTRDLSAFGYGSEAALVADAPVAAAAPPRVVVQSDTVEGTRRRVTLGVRSSIGAERLLFQPDPGGRTRILALNGQPMSDPDSIRGVEHWGVPDSLVVLELDMPADDPIGLHVVEHLLRPRELLGATTFERPAHLAPDVSRMSDRAALRFSVAAFADPRHAFMPTLRAAETTASAGVEIEYIAHAAFLLRTADGTELLVDPYASREWLGYDWPEGIEPDAILITHPHYDHDAGRYLGLPFPWGDGVPVVDSPGSRSFGDFTVTGVRGKHADPYGMEFGQLNTIMVVEAAGLRIAHLGDNGPLTPSMADGLGRVDVLMMPADGVDHILSTRETADILALLSPRIVIPMHYRLPDLEVEPDSPSDLGDIEPWLEGRPGVARAGAHTITLSTADLPDEPRILVLEHAPYVTRPTGQ